MSKITFKGVSNEDLGMVVSRMPDMVRPKRRYTKQEIPGRHGALYIDENAYETISLNVVLNAFGNTDTDKIHEWLNGSGDLILSDDPTKRYKAHAFLDMRSSRYRVGNNRNFDGVNVVFECDPFRYESTPEQYPLNGRFTLTNPGTVPADPMIIVHGQGQVTLAVGDITVTLDNMDGVVSIDCDGKCAFKGENDRTPTAITLNEGEWPKLGLGNTLVDWVGNAKVTIIPNWRWL